MKYIKFLLVVFSLFSTCWTVSANSNSYHQLDSLEKTILFKSDDLSIKEKGKILNNIANLNLDLGNFKEAKKRNWESLRIYKELKDYRNVSKVLLDLGICNIKQNQYDKAFRFYYASVEMLELAKPSMTEKDFTLYKGILFMNIGIIYEETKNYDPALKYMNRANNLLHDADSTYIAVVSANLGLVYGGLHQYLEARKHFQKAIDHYPEDNSLDNHLAIAYNNLGDTYYSTKDYIKALNYYKRSLSFYQDQSIFLSERASVLTSIAEVYTDLKDYDKAKENVERAIELSYQKGGDRYTEDMYEILVEIYTGTNDPEKAFTSLKTLNKIKDSIYNPEILGNIADIQKEYDLKQTQKENVMKVHLLKQEQLLDRYKLYAFLGVFSVLFLITLFLFYRQQQRSKIGKMKLKTVRLEQQQLSDQLKFKNNQLTNYAMYIVKKNEFLEGIKEEIDGIKNGSNDNSGINSLSLIVNQHISSTRERKDFEIRIEKENEDFFYKLQKNFPGLTDKDKKLCSLLLLDLSSKEISALMNITLGSVEKSRHRLRKKLNISSDISISHFLNNL